MVGDTALAEFDSDLEPGVLYRYRLYIHCGMDYLGSFNGQTWWLTDGTADSPSTEQAERWNATGERIYGYLTLVDDDRIEYSLADGTVIATYAPDEHKSYVCL